MSAAIETRLLTKRYGRSRGVEDLSFTVAHGEVFGFLGPNGAGKTTTVRTLLDLLHPTSGTAEVLGLDSRRESLAIRGRVGNLPGDFSYDPAMTGRELLGFLGALRGIDGIGRGAALAERFAADLDRPLGELSHGNRQKIGLLQALFHEPELLILDEPTSGLDPLGQEAFLAVVAEERSRGRTVLLSSHDLDEVQRACDRVAMIREGRLVTVEDVATLIDRSYRHVRIEFDVAADPAAFARLPGVSDLEVDGPVLAFRVEGELDPVVKAAAAHRVVDLRLERPSLEEVFLTRYGTPEAV